MKKRLLALTGMLSLTISPFAFANEDAGLYDPAPPPGSVFVRFAGDKEMKGSSEITAGGKRYDFIDYTEVTPYYAFKKGELDVKVGDAQSKIETEEGKFYTVISSEGAKINTVLDTANSSIAKAQLVLYNLNGNESISVKTKDGKVEIITPTDFGKSNFRELNAVKVSLGVFAGETLIKDLGEISLERGRSYSVFVFDKNNVEWVPAVTNTSR